MAILTGGVNITGLVASPTNNASNSGSVNTGTQFSSVLASTGGMTGEQASAALANNPNATPQQIYDFMKQSGVDISQLSRVSGKSISEIESTANSAGITDNMLAQIGYSPSLVSDGITVGGTTYSSQQVKEFYANGGNDVQFAEQHGITDPGKIHDLVIQARAIAGSANPTGDAALQHFFELYQQYNPSGVDANNFSQWVQNQNPGTLNAIVAGIYTGAAIDPMDYAPGGIYGPGSTESRQAGYGHGLGPRGDGGNWGSTG